MPTLVDGSPTSAMLDNFERAAEDPLSFGGKWSALYPGAGQLRVTAPVGCLSAGIGAADAPGSGSRTVVGIWTDSTFAADQEVAVWVLGGGGCGPTLAIGEDYRLYARVKDLGVGTWDLYEAIMANTSGNDTAYIRRYVNGGLSASWQQDIGIGGAIAYKQLLFQVTGTGATVSLKLYGSNDEWATSTLIHSVNDSDGARLTNSGYVGIGTSTNTTFGQPQFDNFVGGEGNVNRPQIYRWIRN